MSEQFPGGFDPGAFANVPLFRELAKVMAWSGGPVNWDLATQTALAVSAPSGDDPISARDSAEFAAAVDVAELWLDQVTTLDRVEGQARRLGEAEWTKLACTSSGLGVYVEPIAAGMGAALTKSLPAEMASMAGPMSQALSSMGALLYGVQVGTVAGHLAGQLLVTYDLGVPTVDPLLVGPVGSTADEFARDYDFDGAEFRHWLALREAAHRRQFAGVAWLRPHIADLIRRFAADADLDPTALMEQFGGLGMSGELNDPEALREALERPGSFHVQPTTAQRATLARLQSLVAFTEAWVDTVLRAAAADKLPALGRIEEAINRRRAEKGPGERFLEQLIGLDLRPADLRQGRSFCDAVIAARGQEGLDRAWQRAEYLPTSAELGEPSLWLVRMAAAELENGDD